MNIPLLKPDIGEREIEYVTRVLRSGQLSLGPMLEEFERKFAQYIGAPHAVATNSGTSALHLCIKALGIGHGDEVLTTSFSFVASANCMLYEGALPSFVDIHPKTLNLDPVALREAIARDYVWERAKRRLINCHTARELKAILPVHVFGLPCEMNEICEIAKEFNLHLIEDACEAVGANYCGQRVGTFGSAAVFAFYPNKQITTGEGGMIVTHDPHMAKLCRSLRNQGRDEDAPWLRHSSLGYNYRLSDFQSALGVAQLERIDDLLAARGRVAAMYSRLLKSIPGIVLPYDPPKTERSWFAYVIQLREFWGSLLRDGLMARLRQRGVACQSYFPAIHHQPYFRQYTAQSYRALPQSESASDRCLALPFFPQMTETEVAYVCETVRDLLAEMSPVNERLHHLHTEVARHAS